MRCSDLDRIAETLEREFVDISEDQPELLARHCTEAGQIEKAAGLWGKAGQRSLERSALIKGALFWKAAAMMHHSVVLALTDKASNAIQMLTSAIAAWRSTGTTMWMPLFLPYLALACAKLGQFDDAWRFIGEAMTAIETTKEKWCEAEIHRMAGEIALLSSHPDEGKAEAYFDSALAVARALGWSAHERARDGMRGSTN